MAEIVSLAEHRDAGPPLSGTARCGYCSYEWEAVAPVGAVHLECPSCHRMWGAYKHAVEPPKAFWRCNCGEELFWLTPKGAMCRRCGLVSNDWAN
jgi:hypothetical protein